MSTPIEKITLDEYNDLITKINNIPIASSTIDLLAELIDYYSKNSSLPNNIISNNQNFIQKVIPDLCKSLIKMARINEDDVVFINDIICRFIQGLERHNEYIHFFVELLSRKNYSYTTFEFVIKRFLDCEGYSLFLDLMVKIHNEDLFNLACNLNDKIAKFNSNISSLQSHFCQYIIDSFDSIHSSSDFKKLDPDSVLRKIRLFCSIDNNIISKDDKNIEVILNFITVLFISDNVSFHIHAIKFLNFLQSKKISNFDSHLKSAGFLRMFLTSTFHEQVFKKILEVIQIIVIEENPTVEFFQQLWPIREQNREIFSYVILYSPYNVTINFLKWITEITVTKDVLSFIQLLIENPHIANMEKVKEIIISYFLKLIQEKSEFSQQVSTMMEKLKDILNPKLQTPIYNYCMTQLKDEQNLSNDISILKTLVLLSFGVDHNKDIELLESIYSSNFALQLISIVINRIKITQDNVYLLFSVFTSCAEGWSILMNIISHSYFKKFELGLLEQIKDSFLINFKTSEEVDYSLSTLDTLFVIKMFCFAQMKPKTYNDNYFNPSYLKPSPYNIFSEIIEKIIDFAPKNVSIETIDYYTSLFANIFPIKFEQFADQYLPKIHECLANIDENSLELLTRRITLIYKIIKKNEVIFDLESMGIKRHYIKPIDCITFSVHCYNDQILNLTLSPLTTGDQLKKIVAQRLQIKKKSIFLHNKYKKYIQEDETLVEFEVQNNDTLKMYKSTNIKQITIPNTCLTSLVYEYNNNEIPNTLFNIISNPQSNEELTKISWKLLLLLPNIPSIINELNDTQKFKDHLCHTKTKYELIYLLQTLSESEYKDLFIKENGDSIIVDILKSNSKDLSIISYALKFISPNSSECYQYLLKILLMDIDPNDSKSKIIIEEILDFISNYSNNLIQNDESHIDILMNIICKYNNYNTKIISLISKLPHSQKGEIFHRYITSNEIKKNDFEILSSIINDMFLDDIIPALEISLKYYNISNPIFESVASFIFNLLKDNNSKIQMKEKQIQAFIIENISIFYHPIESLQYFKNTKDIQTVLDVSLIIAKYCEEFNHKFLQYLTELFNFNFDGWNYSYDDSKKNIYCGLRNIGATCYMNSILQQLFFNTQFRNQVLNTAETDPTSNEPIEWVIELKKLFSRLTLSSMKYVDTFPYVSSWKWTDGQPVIPHMQQDASEYLNQILDKFEKGAGLLYQGKIAHIIEAADPSIKYRDEHIEFFYSLQLDIKGFHSFAESFEAFKIPEEISDYHVESLNNKITIHNSYRIKEAPKFLCIQLKRFSFDISTCQRIKIIDRFEFPMNFDLQPLMIDNSSHKYKFKGVVCHGGTIQGGHYISYIKNDGIIYKFDDVSVSKVSGSQWLDDAFGPVEEEFQVYESNIDEIMHQHHFTGYLIFYELDEENLESKSETIIDQKFRTEIEKENEKFYLQQLIFSTPIENLMAKIKSIDLLLKYFLNIYTHLRNPSPKVHDVICSMAKKNSLMIIKYLYDRLETVQKIVINCPKEEVQMALFKLLKNLFSDPTVKSDEEKIPQKFAIHFWNQLSSITNVFTIKYINQIFSEWLNNYPDDAIDLNYHKIVLDYLISTHKKYSSTNSKKNNISKKDLGTQSFIQFILYSMDHYDKEEISFISEHFEEVLQIFDKGDINNISAFINKISNVYQINIFDIFKKVAKTKTDHKMLKTILRILLFNKTIEDPSSFNKYVIEIFDTLSSNNINLKIFNNILKRESPKSLEYICNNLALLLQELIITSDCYQNDNSESLFLELFSFVSPMNNYSRAENILCSSNVLVNNLLYREKGDFVISFDDIALLKILLDNFIPSGLKRIMDNPDRYIKNCNNLDRRFANYLRVLQWIVRRTKYIRLDQIDTLITFFVFLSNLQCCCNFNIIEMWRFLDSIDRQDLYECIKNRITEFFDAATKIYNQPLISNSSFVFLTQVSEKLIEKDKDIIISFFESLRFQTFINHCTLYNDHIFSSYFSNFFQQLLCYYPNEILKSVSNFSESLISQCPFSTFNIFSITKVQMSNSQYNCFLRYFANLPADKSRLPEVKDTFFNLIYMMLKTDNLTPIRPPEIQPNLINAFPLIENYLARILEKRNIVESYNSRGTFDIEGCLAKFMSVYGLDDFNIILDNIKYDETHPLFWMFTALRIALMKDKDDESTADEFIAITSLLTVVIIENSSNWEFNKDLKFAIDRCILQLSFCKLKGKQWAADLFLSFVQDKSLRNVYTKEFILKEDRNVVDELLDQVENKEEIQSYVEGQRRMLYQKNQNI